eukprot:COSAG02_NODE_688_length_18473_cov_77.428105_4_plen_2693_part_00
MAGGGGFPDIVAPAGDALSLTGAPPERGGNDEDEDGTEDEHGPNASDLMAALDERPEYAEAAAAAIEALAASEPEQLRAIGISEEHVALLTSVAAGGLEAAAARAEAEAAAAEAEAAAAEAEDAAVGASWGLAAESSPLPRASLLSSLVLPQAPEGAGEDTPDAEASSSAGGPPAEDPQLEAAEADEPDAEPVLGEEEEMPDDLAAAIAMSLAAAEGAEGDDDSEEDGEDVDEGDDHTEDDDGDKGGDESEHSGHEAANETIQRVPQALIEEVQRSVVEEPAAAPEPEPPTAHKFVRCTDASIHVDESELVATRAGSADSTSWVLCALGSGSQYIEMVVEEVQDRTGPGGAASFAVGDEVAYLHYSGCTVAGVDAGTNPATCSISIPGIGTRDGIPVAQVRRLARPDSGGDTDELEERIMSEVRLLRDRLAAAGAREEEEEAMRAVFERRIMLLEEEISNRRVGGGRERLSARGGFGGPRSHSSALRHFRIGIMAEGSARRSLSDRKLVVDEAWLLQGTRVTKGTNTVSRSYPAFVESVNVGDRIGVMVDDDGQLYFYLNGAALGKASPGLPTATTLHLVLDFQGTLKSVRLTPDVKKPMTQQELEKDLLTGLVKSSDVTVKKLDDKIAEPGGESAVMTADVHKRLPLHHLCQNGKVTAGMLKCLTDVDSDSIAATDSDGNTALLCLLKMANADGTITCDRGHALSPDPRRFNYCDVCRATGTKYRCSQSCDYDMCESCFQKKSAKVKKPKGGASLDTVRHLVETNREVVKIADANGKLPVQVAADLDLAREIVSFLLEVTQALGVVWLGAPSCSSGIGVHLFVHAMQADGDRDPDAATKQLRFDTSFKNLTAKEKASGGEATSLNNLPFKTEEVAQSVCGPAHIAFSLHDGRIFRLHVDTIEQQASARVASATQQRLDSTKRDLDYHKQKQKETEEALEKLDARRYSVPEEEIEQLVAISAKTAEECKDILSRYAPGGNRMSLASNEVFGVELAGGEVDDFAQGDKKGELKYAIKSMKKKVAQIEARIDQLTSQVEAEKESQSAVAVLKVGQLEQWADAASKPRSHVGRSRQAVQIAATRSELVALSASGTLYSWDWGAPVPVQHPRAADLCPPSSEDPIIAVSCSDLRTSVLTQDGRVASWMDPLCCHKMPGLDQTVGACEHLEHKATAFACFDSKVVQLAVSDYGTCAVTASGSAFWWGQRPWPMRTGRFKAATRESAATDQIYQDYVETLSRKERKKVPSKEALVSIVTDLSTYEEAIAKEEKVGSRDSMTRAGLLRQLNACIEDAADTAAEMQQGDIVVRRPGGKLCLHDQGSPCIARVDGRAVLAKLGEPICAINTSPVEVQYDGRTLQCCLQDLTMLVVEHRPKQVVLSCLDKERGIAVTCELANSPAEPDSYDTVDLSKLAAKTSLHDDLESIVVEPIQIMNASRLNEPIEKYALAQQLADSKDATSSHSSMDDSSLQMCEYYTTCAKEPCLREYYNCSDRSSSTPTIAQEYEIDEVVVDLWTVRVLLRKAGTLYRYVAQLHKGSWLIEPERCLDMSRQPVTTGRILVANAVDSPVVHIDEGGYICSARAGHLPATEFASIGHHQHKLWGLNVVFGIFGFSEDQQSRRCNSLHDALGISSTNWTELMEDKVLAAQLPQLLFERDSFGATAFFRAMARGNLAAANAIRLKVQELVEAGDHRMAQGLILPDIFGTPPLHALLGLGDGAALASRSKGTKRDSRKIYTQPGFEVTNAGSAEINGVYHPAAHKDYRGPTLYRKVDAEVYMFRWRRKEWIIGLSSDFSDSRPRSANYYTVASGNPPADLPPEGSWQVSEGGSGSGPGPQVFKHPGLLEMLLSHDSIVTARSAAGETALEAHIRSRARSPPRTKSDDIAKMLAANPAAVHGCFHDAAGTPVSASQLDDFVCRLVSCGSSVASPLARKVSEMAAEHGPEARAMGDRFMESCTRIFVTLFSSDNIHSATAELRTVFTSIFKEAPQPAIISLAKQADAVLQLVRVGLALPPLHAVSTYTSPPRAGSRSGGEMAEITGAFPSASSDAGGNSTESSSRVPFSLRITARRSSRDRAESRRSSSTSNSSGSGSTVEGRKLERVKIFHLCVVEVTALMGNIASSFPRALSRTYSTAHPWQSRHNETDMAMMEAAKILQSSWDYLFECADIMESLLECEDTAGVQSAEPIALSAPATRDSTLFIDYLQRARGRDGDPRSDREHCAVLALIMDALVRFKLCLPDIDAVSTDVLVPTVSVFQLPAPENFRDLESAEKSEQLLKKIGIDVHRTDEERRAGSDNDGSSRALLEYPLLKALFRWRRTLAVLTTIPEVLSRDGTDDDSFLNLFEPFDKKHHRLKGLMSDRRRTISEKSKPLCIRVRRAPADSGTGTSAQRADADIKGQQEPSPLAQDLFDGLAKELQAGEASDMKPPLCRNLDKKNPWYKDAPGVGEGVVRMVLSDLANSLLAGVGAAEGLMMPAPLVSHPEDGDLAWWQVNPMARVAPAPLDDTISADAADFGSKSIGELKQFLKQRKLPQSELESCVEKSDLIDLCRKTASADVSIRLQRFRAIGNLLGLCVLHDNLNLKLPLFFCRHVYKFLLGRKVTFADFAFFDSEAYKVLFDLVKSAADMAADEELGFDWDSAGIEGPSGDLPVVAKQVHAFVLRKVKFEMVDKVQEELKALKRVRSLAPPAGLRQSETS